MKFIEYITNKINKAYKPESNMLWATTSISTKELYFFNKGIEKLDLDTYVRGRGESKKYEIQGYKFEFGVGAYDLKGYTQVETPEGIFFKISDIEYRNQKSVELRFYIGE